MRNHPSLRKKILLICQLIHYFRYLHSQNVAIINNNDLKLCTPSGKKNLTTFLKKSKKAKHDIHLEYFNFRNRCRKCI